MERTYTHTITTLDGDEKEITLNRLTMRHGMRLSGLSETEAVEVLVDMIAPGVLDEIAPDALSGLVDAIMEKEQSFFDQLAKSMIAPAKSRKRTRKSK